MSLQNRLAAEAARLRSKHLTPSAEAMSVRLAADRDLTIQTEFPIGWWGEAPEGESFREALIVAIGGGTGSSSSRRMLWDGRC